jgi:hypothetical protein
MEYLYDYIYYSLGYNFFRFSCSHGMVAAFARAAWLKEYHEKVLVEIYRSPLLLCLDPDPSYTSAAPPLSLPRRRSIPYLHGATPLPPLRSFRAASAWVVDPFLSLLCFL